MGYVALQRWPPPIGSIRDTFELDTEAATPTQVSKGSLRIMLQNPVDIMYAHWERNEKSQQLYTTRWTASVSNLWRRVYTARTDTFTETQSRGGRNH